MDDVKSQMEGVTRIYQQLDEKITDHGGVQNLFGINRKIRQALELRLSQIAVRGHFGRRIVLGRIGDLLDQPFARAA